MSDETRHDWTEDDGFAAFLGRHGEAYNPPPETPVEAIWEGIREGRERGADAASAAVVPIAARRWFRPALAVAAVLILGIAIGRISMRQAGEMDGPAGPRVATTDAPAPEPRATADSVEPTAEPIAPSGPGDLAAADAPAPDAEPARRDAAAPTRPTPRTPAADRPAAEPDLARDDAAPRRSDGRDLYRLASVQMLAQAEALLVDYRSGRTAGREDAQIGRWARDVLSSTRLLLDSPAARDPEMRHLLEDLELVLAQIVHHTGADPIEGEMIDRSIEEHDLIPRLRTAIPSEGVIGT